MLVFEIQEPAWPFPPFKVIHTPQLNFPRSIERNNMLVNKYQTLPKITSSNLQTYRERPLLHKIILRKRNVWVDADPPTAKLLIQRYNDVCPPDWRKSQVSSKIS